jgi:hypothetical protein
MPHVRAVFLAAALAAAGSAAAAPRFLSTNRPEVRAVAGPAAGFDPVRASDRERADYGFPPAPDALRAPEAYAHWARAMRASRTRIVPKLAVSTVRHGAMRRGIMAPGPAVHSSIDTSTNWSGAVLPGSATSFGPSSYWLIGADMIVPEAAQPFNTCTGGWLYDSAWVGLDGYTNYSSDVLQAGLDADAFCADGQTATNYDVWYEWAPGLGTTIQNMTVQPGDELHVVVWAVNGSNGTEGETYIVDENTGQSVAFYIDPPAGTTLIGNSAEFITERPEVNNKLATLARYTVQFFTTGYIFNNLQVPYFPGGANMVDVTMIDDNAVPISAPQVLGGASVSTYDEGSAK